MPKRNLKFLTIPYLSPVQETARARRLMFDDGTVCWLPKSQTEDWKQTSKDVSFWLPDWLVIEKELEDFLEREL